MSTEPASEATDVPATERTNGAASDVETDPASDAGAHFCECGSIRHPVAPDGWRCRDCGRTADRGAEAGIVTTTPREEAPPRMATGDWEVLFEHQLYDCPDCGSDAVAVVVRQTRAADEPGTECFTCVTCGHDWRDDGV
jgi:DNA-directed RNA polymerase subunit M/transcription elongation factor TFIIS